MAFTAVPKKDGTRLFGVALRSVGKNLGSIRVSLGADVRESLSLTRGDFVTVFIGSGDDTGYLATKKSPAGYKLFTTGTGVRSLSLTTALKPLGLSAPKKTIRPPYRIDGDMLVIDCRKLLPAAEQSEAV